MNDPDRLKLSYDEVLAKGPFPTEECGQARITAAAHGELILYLADIAGLASRGEKGLAALPECDRAKFRKLASSGISTRVAGIGTRVTPQATPRLHALIEAAEQASLRTVSVRVEFGQQRLGQPRFARHVGTNQAA